MPSRACGLANLSLRTLPCSFCCCSGVAEAGRPAEGLGLGLGERLGQLGRQARGLLESGLQGPSRQSGSSKVGDWCCLPRPACSYVSYACRPLHLHRTVLCSPAAAAVGTMSNAFGSGASADCP